MYSIDDTTWEEKKNFEKITPHFILRTMHYFKWGRLLHSLCALMVGNI